MRLTCLQNDISNSINSISDYLTNLIDQSIKLSSDDNFSFLVRIFVKYAFSQKFYSEK